MLAVFGLGQDVSKFTAHWLKPHIETEPKLLSQLDNAKVARNRRPVVDPTNDPIAFLGIVPMLQEVSGSVFEFDSDALFAEISHAVRISTLDTLNAKTKAGSREVGEQEHDALFIIRCEIERCSIGQMRWADGRMEVFVCHIDFSQLLDLASSKATANCGLLPEWQLRRQAISLYLQSQSLPPTRLYCCKLATRPHSMTVPRGGGPFRYRDAKCKIATRHYDKLPKRREYRRGWQSADEWAWRTSESPKGCG